MNQLNQAPRDQSQHISDAPDLGAVAQVYAHAGWHVFPCGKNKRPYTSAGFQDASTEQDRIAAWWSRWPDAAIGVACGASGLVVLDYDPKNDPGGTSKAEIGSIIGNLETRSASTGSGGTHYYFQAPPSTTIRNSAGVLGPGVDVRGDGGYVIAPPSENEAGPYRWCNRHPWVPLPPTLLSRLQSRPEVQRTESHDPAAGRPIPEGQRNPTLASLAGTLWKRGMSPLAVEAALLAENSEHCDPPLPESEVRHIAHSIMRYPIGEPAGGASMRAGEPQVELLAQDALRITVALQDGGQAAFSFTELEKDRRELACHLSLAFFGAAEPYQQRLNLESSSARTDLRRELDSLYGKDRGWAAALNSVWTLARTTFLEQDRSVRVADIPLLMGRNDLIAPLMPAEGFTILFGDGSSSKSYIALALALAGVTGEPMAGVYEVPPSRVLYIDYEDSDTNFRRRSHRILRGANQSIDDTDLFYWAANGIPLRDQVDAIRRTCDRNAIDWLIVDSVAPACGGPPEEAESAVKFFAALKRIGRPCLGIAHITKGTTGNPTDKPFGTAFWHNLARRTWYVARQQEEDSDDMLVGLYCKKVNDGPKPHAQGLTVHFEAEDGPVTFSPYDVNRSADLAKHTPLQNQIWSLLTSPMTPQEIAETLDCGEAVIRTTLNRYRDRFVEAVDAVSAPGKNGRPAKRWARLQRPEETVHHHDDEEASF